MKKVAVILVGVMILFLVYQIQSQEKVESKPHI
jgi:hypothetical protein